MQHQLVKRREFNALLKRNSWRRNVDCPLKLTTTGGVKTQLNADPADHVGPRTELIVLAELMTPFLCSRTVESTMSTAAITLLIGQPSKLHWQPNRVHHGSIASHYAQ